MGKLIKKTILKISICIQYEDNSWVILNKLFSMCSPCAHVCAPFAICVCSLFTNRSPNSFQRSDTVYSPFAHQSPFAHHSCGKVECFRDCIFMIIQICRNTKYLGYILPLLFCISTYCSFLLQKVKPNWKKWYQKHGLFPLPTRTCARTFALNLMH